MSRFTPSVVTANRLIQGDAVWLTADDCWSPDITDAELIEDEAIAQLRLLHAQAQPHLVVDAYLAVATPQHFREAFRARGPSNRPHGKQELRHV